MKSENSRDSVLSGLTDAGDNQPGQLLQRLITLQHRHSYIPPREIETLSASLDIPAARIQGVIAFYSFLHDTPRGQYDILLSDSITDHMLGSRHLLARLCAQLGVEPGIPRADGRVTVDVASCTGLCDQGPALLVNGRAISRLDEGRILAIARLVEDGIPLSGWPDAFFQVADNIQRRDMLLGDNNAGHNALDSLINSNSDAILAELERSGLRGCGGAGFKTAAKWRFCRDARADQHFVVCNADEGEPGTFKDRILLNSHADRVFEGMTLCAGVIGARQGYLYLRGEYRYLLEDLQATLERRRQSGLLGRNILNQPGFDFDIAIHLGAGAYICGEESALIESLEGKRGIPRKRPPFPVTHGLRNQPTVVNNVETFLAAAQVAAFGGDSFRAVGTEQSTGTKLLSISGDCARPGIYEYPFGTSIRQILEDCGAEATQAVQIAGAAGQTIPASEFNRAIAFEDLSTGGSFMIFNQERDLLDMVQNFARFFRHESCGFCTPCRVGGALMSDLVDKVHAGRASSHDLEEMRAIGGLMRAASHCGLGATAANPVLDTLEGFPAIYAGRLGHSSYEPSFDLDAALEEARNITGRDDSGAHLKA